jgi:hypothetical protein
MPSTSIYPATPAHPTSWASASRSGNPVVRQLQDLEEIVLRQADSLSQHGNPRSLQDVRAVHADLAIG